MNSIFHRISVRKYEDRPVEKEKIMEILRAGMQAPSACNQQPWEFYLVTDKEKIRELSKVTPYTGCAAEAPVVIVPVYHTEGLAAPSFVQTRFITSSANSVYSFALLLDFLYSTTGTLLSCDHSTELSTRITCSNT